MPRKVETKYKTYKSDAAPFFFYIDVIPLDLTQYEIKHHLELLKTIQYNPIMPLPSRVDRVYNGVSSTLIKPRNPISFSIGENNLAILNPTPFIRFGIEKLLHFTEIRASGQFAISLYTDNARKWWNATRFLYAKLRALEEDFAAFLRAYIYIVLVAKLNEEDLVGAAIKYCELIKDVCEKRINDKQILVEAKDRERIVNMYKMKEGRVQQKRFKFSKESLLYPSFVDIEVVDSRNLKNSPVYEVDYSIVKKISKSLKYIPLLIYDDLLECMLQNLKALEAFEGNIMDPSFLLENKIILLVNKNNYSSDQLKNYSWLDDFDAINIDSILKSIRPTFTRNK